LEADVPKVVLIFEWGVVGVGIASCLPKVGMGFSIVVHTEIAAMLQKKELIRTIHILCARIWKKIKNPQDIQKTDKSCSTNEYL
jgi:hypothetical protein